MKTYVDEAFEEMTTLGAKIAITPNKCEGQVPPPAYLQRESPRAAS